MLQQLAQHLTLFIERFFPSNQADEEEVRRATIFAWICIGIVLIITLLTIIDVVTSNLQYLFEIMAFNAFVAKRKAINEAKSKPAFEMCVGIHAGPVVAGIV